MQHVFQRNCWFHMSVQKLQITSEDLLFLLMMKISFSQRSIPVFVQPLTFIIVQRLYITCLWLTCQFFAGNKGRLE